MKKEINLAHLGEIDKVHTLSSTLMSTVNTLLEHIGIGKKSKNDTEIVGNVEDIQNVQSLESGKLKL